MKKYYAAIDLHSNNLMIVIVTADGKRIKQAKLLNEMHAIAAFLKPFRKQIDTIAVESTFNWYWLVDGLEDLGYKVVLANPAAMEQYTGLKHADDKSDAHFIAEMLRLGILPTGHIYDRNLRGIRDLFRRRMQLVGKRTALMLSIRNLHSRTHGCGFPPAEVKKCPPNEIIDRFLDPAERLVAEIQKQHIDGFTASIKRMEAEVRMVARKLPNYHKLQTMSGVGDILGMTIVMEAGTIDRFATAEDFASYCRTVPAKRITNGKQKGENNRKCGNRYLAWAFIEAANLIRQKDPRARRWFDRKAAKTNRIIATKALACKLAKAAWHILKGGTVYDGDRLFGALPKSKQPVKQMNLGARSSQRKGLSLESPD